MKATTYVIGKDVYVFVRDNLAEMMKIFIKNKTIDFKTEKEAKNYINRKEKACYGMNGIF